MKTIILITMISLINMGLSQTSVTSFYVSGTWTLAGSPYLIQNDITVLSSQTLFIEQGVEVKFQKETNLTINGQMIADGVTFEAIDTTGWSNQTTTNGGWNGIHFMPFTGIDNSIFNNCIVRDCKYGYSYTILYSNAFTCCRQLNITNCLFENNHSGTGTYISDMMIYLAPQNSSDTIIFDKCTVRNNYSVFGAVRNSNYYGGYTSITNAQIYNNNGGSAIWSVWNNLLIENNDIYSNVSIGDNSAIKLSIGDAIVRGNKIHHNECDELAAVGCRSGNVLIENNLICNNIQNSGDCGMLGGGGGINLSHNEGGASFSDTYYVVRNNVISNNYSGYGGGGIYVYNSRATISNNHIINNSAITNGTAILISSPLSEVIIKNNLFFGKDQTGIIDSVGIIHVISAADIEFDFNYTPSHFNTAITYESSFNIIGDSTHNIIGSNPEMISPTVNNQSTTNALFSDFNISPNSLCIDNGDTSYAQNSSIDYLANQRIINNVIDIGAFENLNDLNVENSISNQEIDFNLYPNPVSKSGQLIIETSSQGVIKVTDVNGKVVRAEDTQTSKTIIELSGLESGLYVIIFEGEYIVSKKIVVTN